MKQSTLLKRLNKALTATYIDGKDRYSNSDYAVIAVKRYIYNGTRNILTVSQGKEQVVKLIRLLNDMGLKYKIEETYLTIQQSVEFPKNLNYDSHAEII